MGERPAQYKIGLNGQIPPGTYVTWQAYDALVERLVVVEKERDELTRLLAQNHSIAVEKLAKAETAHVTMQQHRDAWRSYAYGKRDKPSDFLDGNLVDRPPTQLEKAEAELERSRNEHKETYWSGVKLVAERDSKLEKAEAVCEYVDDNYSQGTNQFTGIKALGILLAARRETQ